EFFGFVDRLRLGEQITLTVVASETLKQGELGLGLDALGDDFLLEILCERDDGLEDLRILAALADAVNERAVDLERVEGQAMQIAEARISRAKIIDAELYAQAF